MDATSVERAAEDFTAGMRDGRQGPARSASCATCSSSRAATRGCASVRGRAAETLAVTGRRGGRGRPAVAPVRPARVLHHRSGRGVVEPRALRRHPLRPPRPGRRGRPGPVHALAGRGLRPESRSAASCSARTRCRPATTTPTTARRRRCARSSSATSSARSPTSTCCSRRRRRRRRSRSARRPPTRVAMYLSDVFTIPVNLAGIPAISVPCGLVRRAAGRPAAHGPALRASRRCCARVRVRAGSGVRSRPGDGAVAGGVGQVPADAAATRSPRGVTGGARSGALASDGAASRSSLSRQHPRPIRGLSRT